MAEFSSDDNTSGLTARTSPVLSSSLLVVSSIIVPVPAASSCNAAL